MRILRRQSNGPSLHIHTSSGLINWPFGHAVTMGPYVPGYFSRRFFSFSFSMSSRIFVVSPPLVVTPNARKQSVGARPADAFADSLHASCVDALQVRIQAETRARSDVGARRTAQNASVVSHFREKRFEFCFVAYVSLHELALHAPTRRRISFDFTLDRRRQVSKKALRTFCLLSLYCTFRL